MSPTATAARRPAPVPRTVSARSLAADPSPTASPGPTWASLARAANAGLASGERARIELLRRRNPSGE